MSYQLLSESHPVAAKVHRCIWCGQDIPVGETHRHERSIYEGEFQNHRWHSECDDVFTSMCTHGEESFEPYENERPTLQTILRDALQTSEVPK